MVIACHGKGVRLFDGSGVRLFRVLPNDRTAERF
jgi:hypothetical protein